MYAQWSSPSHSYTTHRLPGYVAGLRMARYLLGPLLILSLLAL